MTIYWLMLFVPIMLGGSQWRANESLSIIQWSIYGVLLVLIIGFRYQTGGDWYTYIDNYLFLKNTSLIGSIEELGLFGDPGFTVIHWFSMNYFNGAYFTNFISAIIFVYGLIKLCRNMPIPWLALTLSIPYLVIVVSFGYLRQSIAIGFLMLGLVNLMFGNGKKYYLAIALGSLFHATVFIMIFIGYFYRNKLTNFRGMLFFLLFSLVFLSIILSERFAFMLYHYVQNTELHSSGAIIRASLNMFAVLVFLYFRKSWEVQYKDSKLWVIFSVVSIAMFPLVFEFSTTIDRLSLYLIPMQLVIFSRIPTLILHTNIRGAFIISIIILYVLMMFFWFNYGNYSHSWLPYQNLLSYL